MDQAFGAASPVPAHSHPALVQTLDLQVQSMLEVAPKEDVQHERQTVIIVPTRCHGKGQGQGVQAMTPWAPP
jgi:hypothetical protein